MSFSKHEEGAQWFVTATLVLEYHRDLKSDQSVLDDDLGKGLGTVLQFTIVGRT